MSPVLPLSDLTLGKLRLAREVRGPCRRQSQPLHWDGTLAGLFLYITEHEMIFLLHQSGVFVLLREHFSSFWSQTNVRQTDSLMIGVTRRRQKSSEDAVNK